MKAGRPGPLRRVTLARVPIWVTILLICRRNFALGGELSQEVHSVREIVLLLTPSCLSLVLSCHSFTTHFDPPINCMRPLTLKLLVDRLELPYAAG